MNLSEDRGICLKCSTVLLIRDEEDNIEPLTKEILQVYRSDKIDGEVVLVDDGSADRSPAICDDLARRYENVRVIHHEVNKGRSFAIRTGFQESRGDVIIIMDGDRQYEPKEIPLFLEKIAEGYDVVTGWRHQRTDSFIRKYISRVYNSLIIQRRFGMNIKDQNSGFKAFRREKAVSMQFDPEGYRGLHRFILPLAALHGMRIAEIPINHYARPTGKSYIRSYTVMFITLSDYNKFKKQHGLEIEAIKKRR
jgi:glycosyltransferase involved in cell wall biosynthesis